MDASRAQGTVEPTQGHSLWSWVAIGAVVALLAAAISLGLASDLGDTTSVVRAPASPATQAVTGERPTSDYALRGRGNPETGLSGAATGTPRYLGAATAIREGGDYAGGIPVGTPDTWTSVRESGAYRGAYYGSGTATATPRAGRCPVKQGC
ncbi:MAG: hypothetical protein ACRDHI_09160 [Actinomycetota bacterium]